MQNLRPIGALLAIAAAFLTFDRCLAAEALQAIDVPGDRAFMENIDAGPDGTLYVSSLASGGIARVKPGASKAEGWIAPAAFESSFNLRAVLAWMASPLGAMATSTSIRSPPATFSVSRSRTASQAPSQSLKRRAL